MFHASLADRFGNVFIGRERELLIMAHASQRALATVEQIVDHESPRGQARAGAVHAFDLYGAGSPWRRSGAWPVGLPDHYSQDEAEIARYAAAARTPEGFADYLNDWLGETQGGGLSGSAGPSC